MTELQNYIRTYFSLSKEDLEKVASMFQYETIEKGDFLVKEDQYCQKMSFVKDGLIRLYAHKGGKEVTQWISTKGYFVVDIYSFLFDRKSRWNIQALTGAELFSITKTHYHQLQERVPKWPAIEKQFIASCFVILENRVFDHLSLSAEERYDKLFEENKELFNQVPLQYLASMLGMTPETFSRIRNKKLS